MVSSSILPIIDFTPLLTQGDEVGKKRVVEEISKACTECGFFQVVNHGIPVELLKQTLEVYRSFFQCSDEEKLKYVPKPGVKPPAGYFKSPDLSKEGNEHFLISTPSLVLKQYPKHLPEFKYVFLPILFLETVHKSVILWLDYTLRQTSTKLKVILLAFFQFF